MVAVNARREIAAGLRDADVGKRVRERSAGAAVARGDRQGAVPVSAPPVIARFPTVAAPPTLSVPAARGEAAGTSQRGAAIEVGRSTIHQQRSAAADRQRRGKVGRPLVNATCALVPSAPPSVKVPPSRKSAWLPLPLMTPLSWPPGAQRQLPAAHVERAEIVQRQAVEDAAECIRIAVQHTAGTGLDEAPRGAGEAPLPKWLPLLNEPLNGVPTAVPCQNSALVLMLTVP